MEKKQVCLVFKCTGSPFKICNLIEVLPFVGCLKQLSVAIDTGAAQIYPHLLQRANGLEYQLKCSFAQEVVALELRFREVLRFSWEGTAKEFRIAVDRMIAKLPPFF